MKGIMGFDEFVKRNIAKEQSIDRSRAEFLAKEAEKSYANLLTMIEKLKINNLNANMFVKSCHDILMELVRAKMLLDGYNASGLGAHEAEVSYLRVLSFTEKEVQFADQMRFFRNGILYYGTSLDQEYARQVVEFTNRIYPQLKKMLSNNS